MFTIQGHEKEFFAHILETEFNSQREWFERSEARRDDIATHGETNFTLNGCAAYILLDGIIPRREFPI